MSCEYARYHVVGLKLPDDRPAGAHKGYLKMEAVKPESTSLRKGGFSFDLEDPSPYGIAYFVGKNERTTPSPATLSARSGEDDLDLDLEGQGPLTGNATRTYRALLADAPFKDLGFDQFCEIPDLSDTKTKELIFRLDIKEEKKGVGYAVLLTLFATSSSCSQPDPKDRVLDFLMLFL